MNNYSIEISEHAYLRIKQRLKTSDKKIPGLVEKAWRSNNKIPKLFKSEYKNRRHHVSKAMMGYVWVFAYDGHKLILVTVY